MDVMRGLQGLGPAAAIPASLGILAQSFEEGSMRRTVAFATFSSGAPIGAAIGNVVSSLLTQYTRYVLLSLVSINNLLCAALIHFTLTLVQYPTAHRGNPHSTSKLASRD